MSWTKRQIVNQAFNELGYASFAYTLSDAQLLVAKYQLDALVGEWNAYGIEMSYPLSDTQNNDLDDDSNIPDWAISAIYKNLAVRLAPSIGKQAPNDLRIAARDGYKAVLRRQSFPRERQFPETLPYGAGNRPWIFGQNYFPTPSSPEEIFQGDGTMDDLP